MRGAKTEKDKQTYEKVGKREKLDRSGRRMRGKREEREGVVEGKRSID